VLDMLKSTKGSIADVGCGPAIYSEELLAQGFAVVEKQSYDFRLPFLEKFCRKGAVRLMKMLHPVFSKSGIFGWLGEGYIVKACKQ